MLIIVLIKFSGANKCDIFIKQRPDLSDASSWTVEFKSIFDTNATWYHVVNGHPRKVINSFQFAIETKLLVQGKYTQLIFRHLTVENNGEYKCVVSNTYCEKSTSYNVTMDGKLLLILFLFYLANIKFAAKPELFLEGITTIKPGERLSVNCTVIGHPKSNVSFRQNVCDNNMNCKYNLNVEVLFINNR